MLGYLQVAPTYWSGLLFPGASLSYIQRQLIQMMDSYTDPDNGPHQYIQHWFMV